MEIWIIFSLILFTAIACFRLNWALFLILFALPAYLIRFNIGQIPSTMLEAMILIVFFVWLFKDRPWQIFKKINWSKKREKYPYYLEIIGILIAAFLGLIIAAFNYNALGIFKAYFLQPIMLYLVLINRGYTSIRKFIWPLAISALIVSLIAFIQQLTGQFTFNDFWLQVSQYKVSSIFEYPNAVGLYLGPIILLLLGLFLSYPKRTNLINSTKKLFLLITILFSTLAIFLARSEGALIAIVISFLLVAVLANKRSRKIAISILILFIIFLGLHSPSWQYLEKRVTLKDLSGQIRRQQWRETIEMLGDGRWLMGAGLSNYQVSIEPYHGEGIFVKDFDNPDWHRKVVWNEEFHKSAWQPVEIYLYPHNILLNFWTEITIFGALLFIWLIARVIFELIKLLNKLSTTKKAIALGVIGSLSTILIHGLVDVPYFKNDLAVLFWFIIFLAATIKLRSKQRI